MIIDRLKAGLPTQQKAIQSTRAQLRSARADAASSRAKARDLGLEKIVDEMSEEMTDYLKNVDAAKFGAPGAIPDAVRKDLGELIVEFDQMRSLLADFKKAAKAGHEYGKVLAERSHGLAQKMALLNEKLDEAGLWSEAGETVAKIGFGSAGASAFKMAELSIRLSVEIGGALVSDAEARQHEANLAIMEGQSRRIAGEIAEREARLRDVHTRNGCL